jgi:HAD superfamily phosphoserine phosphatase-like hydrolase
MLTLEGPSGNRQRLVSLKARERLQRKHSHQFVNSVLNTRPQIAAFDCDGTLWAGDAGESFFSWELDQRLVSEDIAQWARGRYAAYRAGKVSEDEMCAEMTYMHYGLSETLVQAAANQYFDEFFVPQLFPEMRRLVQKLREQGCEVWAVSSTNEWMIRAGMRHFDIPPDHILATSVVVENGIITDEVIRIPSGPGKPEALRSVLKAPLDAAFGNSKWDKQMLEMAARAYAINPNPDLESFAREKSWRIYFPDTIESA